MPLRAWFQANIQYVFIPIVLGAFLLAWQALVTLNHYPVYILPAPSDIAASFALNWGNGILPMHLRITLFEIALAFALAFIFASVAGYALAKSPLLEKIVSPYLVAAQAIPIVAVAPLFVIWIKTGPVQNAMIGALVSFFPMLVNTVVGLRGIRDDYRTLMRSYAANSWQTFVKLEIPAALPVFFGGVRVGITLAVVGVTVVELLWADRGLGFLMNFARGSLDTPLLFAAVVTLSALALALYLSVVLLERYIIRWRRNSR